MGIENPHLRMRLAYKMSLLLFFNTYYTEHIYYPAGSMTPKLAYETNKEVSKFFKTK